MLAALWSICIEGSMVHDTLYPKPLSHNLHVPYAVITQNLLLCPCSPLLMRPNKAPAKEKVSPVLTTKSPPIRMRQSEYADQTPQFLTLIP
jgi:hypothetical protein